MSSPVDDGRRQLRNVRIDDDLADWAQEQARVRGVGVGPVVEDALRLMRDNTNPRPSDG